MFTIIEDNVRIGFFQFETDRDQAFNEFVLPRSNNCMKSMEDT